MTSVPPTQPPAAPETDVSAVVALLATHGYMPCSQHTPTINAWWAQCEGCDWKGPRRSRRNSDEADHREHVASLIATAARERVRVVEGERDRYRSAWKSAATRAGIAADLAEASRRHVAAPVDGLCQTCGCGRDGDGDCPCGCLEAAERARETFALGAAWALGDDEGTLADLREQVALLTEQRDRAEGRHERLESAIEALAEEFASEVDWSSGRNNYGDNQAWESAARQLRALLPGGAA